MFASFWQVFVQVLYGVADVDAVARDTARSFGLSRGSRIVNLVFPTALPVPHDGLRLAAAVALILAITAEMFIGNPGLGREIVFAQSPGDSAGVYALVIVTGLLGLLINLVFRLIERRSLSWHQSVRGGGPVTLYTSTVVTVPASQVAACGRRSARTRSTRSVCRSCSW